MSETPMSTEQLARAREIAKRATDDPFFVEDCEGSLQVWRESALARVGRDERGEIVSWSTPSVYRPSDQVVEIDLDSWDPGEDEDDDQRRDDIRDLVDGRALVPALLAEVKRLRARIEELTSQRDDLLVEDALAEQRRDETYVPRTERSYWAAIAAALNAAVSAGMPVGIDLDGTLTDRTAWSVIWDRAAERWAVVGYDADELGETGGAS